MDIILLALLFIITGLALVYIPGMLYLAFGLFKSLFHDKFGWHRPDDSPTTFDGASAHSKYKYCGKDIMQDSQGNWF